MQIYKITNLINNKIYIGKDTTSNPSYFGSGLLINRAFDKYGKQNFIKEIIDETSDYKELSEKEIYWISYYNSTNKEIGYNISKGGDGGDTLSNHPDLNLIREKISKNNPKKGKTYEESFGEEKSLIYKEKLKQKIHRSILSPEVRERLNKKWQEYNEKFKQRCLFIKDEIDKGNLNDYLNELKIIKKRVSHNFLKNTNGFYNFFGDDLRFIFGKLKIHVEEKFLDLDSLIKDKNIDGLVDYLNYFPNRFFKNRNEF